jgi:hypothetical protein
MKRPLVADIGAAIEAVASGDLNHLRRLYRQPLAVVGDISRAMVRAQPGYRLITADLSGVESRITAWTSEQQSKLDQWAAFDRTQDPDAEPCFVLGHKIFGLPQEQARATGKTADLAFGYMGGKGAWEKLAPAGDTSTDAEIEKRKQAWRRAHPETVRFWHSLNRAAIKAVQKPGETFRCKRVAFRCDDSFLRMLLPSGREIAYPFPHLKTDNRGNVAVVFMDNDKGQWVECRQGQGAYGGTWCENAVQAIARDLLAAAMPRLESAGYRIVLHIHDEISAEVPLDFGTAEEFLQILTTPPSWADGLPIAAKVREGERFCKIAKPEASPDDDAAPEDPVDDNEMAEKVPTDMEEDAGDDPSEAKEDPSGGPDDAEEVHGGGDNEQANGYASGERLWGHNVTEYIYRDDNGAPYLRVTRKSAKQFPQARLENGRWVWGKPTGPKIPYRLPELLAAAPTTAVFTCEGEKDADNVASLGLVATTNSEGAGKWTTS